MNFDRIFAVCFFLLAGLVAGLYFGTIMTYQHMSPIVEERMIRGVNDKLKEAGYRRLIFHLEDYGDIKLIIKSKGDGDVRAKAERTVQGQ